MTFPSFRPFNSFNPFRIKFVEEWGKNFLPDSWKAIKEDEFDEFNIKNREES